MPPQVAGLTGATLQTAPSVCHECVWWQSRAGSEAEKDRWRERVESEWGAWGTLYVDGDGHLLGSMQYGPAALFPRADELPAGPPSRDAVLVTCAYLADPSTPWVMQSLFLAAIGDARDRGAAALETFSYAYREGESMHERFLVHRTVFPRDFLADLGFRTLRSAGRVELVRLEFGGLQPVLGGQSRVGACSAARGLRSREAGAPTAALSDTSEGQSPNTSREATRPRQPGRLLPARAPRSEWR